MVFEEQNSMLAVEAEYVYKQTKTEIRRWYRFGKNEWPRPGRDVDVPHSANASNHAYLEKLHFIVDIPF
ncbi:MAG: hypothetical protein U5R06_03440 [candidate division KSB1 bacterium]|nr:hypothetical protein [candidate division KSB1 bacterium]